VVIGLEACLMPKTGFQALREAVAGGNGRFSCIESASSPIDTGVGSY
jgi:hypothetical protein